ncbi:zf-HC2 domain-containing protein [Rhodococcus antarcticus]|jgi:anti-sigma-K factor RskA|uniref:Zf-HC2 domain-containing protein n=1 Tax=Rhodococcus antarcticus TaxID=2987751 RepID=A0ABY6P0M1_9NOCA|nr:zf-HC2 domain-containing protein [Rhodococcus antarcticus]UZJ25192.1 zf-HC2 domain-containing protein [Rhodococcus antarcticus]
MAELTHAELRSSLGSYLLGSLEPAERTVVDTHLAGCATCREELSSYAALPALMSRVSIDAVRGAEPASVVPPGVLGRALDAVAAERTATVTHLHRWRLGAVLSAAAAVVVAVVLGVTTLQAQTATTPGGVALVAAAGVTATGTATVEAKPWGTAVTLQLQGLPQGGAFTAWVSAPDGTRALAATWSPTPDGHVLLTGAANIHDTTHAALQVTQDGTTLLTLPAHT